jgi:acyl carrier protein
MGTNEITKDVIIILARYAERETPDITEDRPVFGVGGVISDSIKILDALCDIEAFFKVSIPDEDLNEDLFTSISTLSSYLSSKINAKS